MKRILLAACLAGCALGFGAQTVLAESVKVPVNKISNEGVGEAIGFVAFEDDGKGGMDIMVDVVGIPQGDHGIAALQPVRGHLGKRTRTQPERVSRTTDSVTMSGDLAFYALACFA